MINMDYEKQIILRPCEEFKYDLQWKSVKHITALQTKKTFYLLIFCPRNVMLWYAFSAADR